MQIIEMVIVMFLRLILLCLPFRIVGIIGDGIGALFYFLSLERRRVARENVNHVYGSSISAQRKKKIVMGAFKNAGRVFTELLWITRINKDNYKRYIELKNKEAMDRGFAQKKGVLFMTMHFGNWEYLPFGCVFSGYNLANVFVPVKNRYFNKLLSKLRQHTGAKLIRKDFSIRDIKKYLNRNYGIGLLIDQDANKRGITVPFLGKPSSTPRGLYTLSKKYQAYIVGAIMVRRKGRYTIELLDIGVVKNESEIEFMKRMNDILSDYIFKYPEQWFWVHQRFKTKVQ